jgi:hypothetical protein
MSRKVSEPNINKRWPIILTPGLDGAILSYRRPEGLVRKINISKTVEEVSIIPAD